MGMVHNIENIASEYGGAGMESIGKTEAIYEKISTLFRGKRSSLGPGNLLAVSVYT